MLRYLLRCIACDGKSAAPITSRSFPLCEVCESRLQQAQAPRLCDFCGGPSCSSRGPCLRPWARDPDPRTRLDGFWSLYLLLTPAYEVLKRWKSRGGPGFDRKVLRWNRANDDLIEYSKRAVIVSIPQLRERSWKMGGSRASKLGSWLSELLGSPTAPMLEPLRPDGLSPRPRQAELSWLDRYASPRRVRLGEASPKGQAILLVDDFSTTGHTLRSAAQLLKLGGALDVRGFCLGVRVLDTEQRPNLPHRSRGPVAIGEKLDI